MSKDQRYRLQAAGHRREMVATAENGKVYVDHESGTRFEVVGKLLPLAPSTSRLPWSAENLRACGCARAQLVQKDLNDCPYCGRRMPAAEGTGDED